MAANKQDMYDAWDIEDMRVALRLDPQVKILPCVARKKNSVKSVLLELLYNILEEMDSPQPGEEVDPSVVDDAG